MQLLSNNVWHMQWGGKGRRLTNANTGQGQDPRGPGWKGLGGLHLSPEKNLL